MGHSLIALLLTFGVLLHTYQTADGPISVYRDGQLCILTFRGELAQVVDVETCES